MPANESVPSLGILRGDHVTRAIEGVTETLGGASGTPIGWVLAEGVQTDSVVGDAASGHEPCMYVAREIGSSPNADVSQLNDYPDVVDEIAFTIETAHARGDFQVRGQFGRVALNSLDCSGCRVAAECAVRRHLETDVQVFDIVVGAARNFIDLTRSPAWVVAGRQQRTGVGPHTFVDLPEGDAPIEIDLQDMEFGRGGVDVDARAARPSTKAEIPEIQHITAISEDETLALLPIAAGGRQFTVVDASGAIGFKDKALSDDGFGVLCGKLLGRIVETGPDGESQIMNPDNIMQKVITSVNGALLQEIRMSGKNRLYFTIRPATGDEPARIVILGAHGGDAATQRKFIDIIRP